MDLNPRIKYSLGTSYLCDREDTFHDPRGLAFDHRRSLLYVVDSGKQRVQAFSTDDGSYRGKFSVPGSSDDSFPWGIAIDHDHDRIFVPDEQCVHGWSLPQPLQAQALAAPAERQLVADYFQIDAPLTGPYGIAIDQHHQRILVCTTGDHALVVLSLLDGLQLFKIAHLGSAPANFFLPAGLAIDHDRHRIIVADSCNHRVQVLSLIDGSFLFEFGTEGRRRPGQFKLPQGVCIANQGRIIVADTENNQLQSFTHEGHHIASFGCGYEYPQTVAFDEHRGLIAFTSGNRAHVIGANQWLADTFTWRPDLHRYAPSSIKQAVLTMTMIRSVVDERSAMSMIPNELLFEIFSFL